MNYAVILVFSIFFSLVIQPGIQDAEKNVSTHVHNNSFIYDDIPWSYISTAAKYKSTGEYHTYSFLMKEAAGYFLEEQKYIEADSILTIALEEIYPYRNKLEYAYYNLLFYKAVNYSNWFIPDSSLKYYDEALKLVDIANVEDKALILRNKAYLLRAQKKYNEAGELLTNSLSLYQSISFPPLDIISDIYNSMAIVSSGYGDYITAVEHYEKSLQYALASCQEITPRVAQIQFNIAIGNINRGWYTEGEKGLLEVIHTTHDNKELSRQYFLAKDQLAGLYKRIGHYNRAIVLYKEIIDEMLENGEQAKSTLANAHMKAGLLFQTENNHDRALEFFHKAEEFLDEYKGKLHIPLGYLYGYMAKSYLNINMPQKALDFYLNEFEIMSSMINRESPLLSPRYVDIAEAYEALSILDSSDYYINKAWNLEKKNVNKIQFSNLILQRIARYYMKHNNEPKTLEILKVGYNNSKKFNLAGIPENDLLYLLSYTYYEIDILKSMAYSDELDSLLELSSNAEDIKNHFHSSLQLLFRHHFHRGNIYYKLYKIKNDSYMLNESYKQFQKALLMLEKIKSEYYSKDNYEDLTAKSEGLYEKILEASLLLYNQKKDIKYFNAAFQVMESNKSSLLSEAVRSSKVRLKLGVPEEITELGYSLNTEINFYTEEVNKAEADSDNLHVSYCRNKLFNLKLKSDSLRDVINTRFPNYSTLVYNGEISKPEDIQKVLNNNDILLEYHSGVKNIYIIAITKNELKITSIPVDVLLTKSISEFINYVSNPPTFSKSNIDPDPSTTVLYERLIKPVLKEEVIKKITIIPDKILSMIPFEALKDERGEFLVNKYTIRYSYSAGLMEAEMRAKSIYNVKYFAGFAFDENSSSSYNEDSKSGDLFLAEKEVTTIAKMFNGSAFTGIRATKTNFINNASGYKILHFSLHSHINHSLPIASRILFNIDRYSNDNALSLGEILNLSINSELVVLSACNSGLGKYVAGEGVMSLARGFAYAGCKSMVMSLWPVSDNTAFSIITGFYNGIKTGETKDAALRSAKLSYLEKVSDPLMKHPYYWAAMVPIGNMSPMPIVQEDITDNLTNTSFIYIGGGLIILLVLIYLIKEKITRRQN